MLMHRLALLRRGLRTRRGRLVQFAGKSRRSSSDNNVKKDDGSRAVGTVLSPHGPVFPMIQKGEAYYGDATILGKPYITGYEPIRDASGDVIGIYYVGYLKG